GGRAARPRVAATRSRPRCRHAGHPGLVAAADVLFGHLLRVGGRQVRSPRATRRTRSRGSNLAPWDRRRDLILRGKRLPRRSTLTREAPTHITHPTAEEGQDMSQLGQTVTFATRLYRQRANIAFAGHVKRDPLALLTLRPGRDDPYAIYERMRTSGTLVPTRLGNWSTTSHRVCKSVLRDRRFGVRPAESGPPAPDELDLSFLGMNPPDHTRLRRLAMPA